MLNEPVVDGLRERLILMRSVNSLGRLSDHAMLLIVEHARVRSFADGALALEEGRLESVHVVTTGRFEVTRNGIPVTVVTAGGAIGALSAMAHDSHGVTARSIGPSRTLEIPIDVFIHVCEESFPVLRVGLRVFSRQLIDARGHYCLASGDPPPTNGKGAPEVPRASALELVERVIELSERALFRHWNANAIFDVARAAGVVRLSAGEPLWTAGDRAHAAFHVVSGRIACREQCSRGPFDPGTMLGLLEMLGELPCVHTPVAVVECVLLRIPLEDLLAALDTHRDLALELVAEMSRKLLPGQPPSVVPPRP
jgi:CRP-like cAMP-binding protein